MSDTPQGDGWWQASDGRWYPPEQHPDLASVEPAKSTNRGCVTGALVALGLLVAIGAVGALTGSDDEPSPTTVATTVATSSTTTTTAPAPAAYDATVQDIVVVNPATVTVVATVTNTGGTAGTPKCFVQAQDPAGAYEGYDSFNSKSPLDPGATNTLRGDLVITNEGAAFVTEASITCE